MKSTYSVTEAQSRLPGLLKASERGAAIAIRRRNETVAYLVSRDRMEAIIETLEILANPDAMKAIRGHRAGKTKTVFWFRFHRHRHAVRKENRGAIRDVTRFVVKNLVARINERAKSKIDRFGNADRHEHFRFAVIFHVIIFRDVSGDRLPQFRQTEI